MDASHCVARKSWQVIGRAARGVVQASCATCEVWSLKEASRALQELQDQLSAPALPCCARCGTDLGGLIQGVVVDADQAYEACEASPVIRDWEDIAQQYSKRTMSSRIAVRKSKKCLTKTGDLHFGRSWWIIRLDHIRQAIFAFTIMSSVVVAGHAFSLRGIPIGGIMSGVCVAITLGAQEYRWRKDAAGHKANGFVFDPFTVDQCIGWKRYVDDALIASRRYCRSCCVMFLCAGFGIRFSPTSVMSPVSLEVGIWLDMHIYVRGQKLVILPKNTNRAWLYGVGSFEKAATIPWPGCPPGGFAALRCMFSTRIYRARELGVGWEITGMWLAELILELFLLGYPVSVIRAITHSLPCSPPVQIARKVVRAFQAQLSAQMPVGRGEQSGHGPTRSSRDDQSASAPASGTGREQGASHFRMYGQRRAPVSGPSSRRHSRRTRDSSSSSSSSSSSRRHKRKEKKLERARTLLMGKDAQYRAWREEHERKKSEESLRRQGQALAEALSNKFDELIQASKVAQSPPVKLSNMAQALAASPVVTSPGEAVSFPPEPPVVWNMVRRKWLAAELGGGFELPGDSNAIVSFLADRSKNDRPLARALDKFIRDNMPGQCPPKDLAKRAKTVVDFAAAV